jgi:hypothetical protein
VPVACGNALHVGALLLFPDLGHPKTRALFFTYALISELLCVQEKIIARIRCELQPSVTLIPNRLETLLQKDEVSSSGLAASK